MNEPLQGDKAEHLAINRYLVASDNRQELDRTEAQRSRQYELQVLAEGAESLWEASGLKEDFSELEQTLGSATVSSYTYPLTSQPSFMSYETVPRPVRLGARRIE